MISPKPKFRIAELIQVTGYEISAAGHHGSQLNEETDGIQLQFNGDEKNI